MDAMSMFLKTAQDQLERCSENAYVLSADINNFHSINYLFSVEEGDRFLADINEFLQSLPEVRCCVKVFGDLFLCLLMAEASADIREVMAKNDQAMKKFLTKYQLQYSSGNLQFACGVCEIRQGRIGQAIDGANMARKESKKLFIAKSILYDLELRQRVISRSQAEQSLHNALVEQRFCFYLQPKVSLQDGRIVGAEALARRIDDNGAVIYPDVFLSLMEENGDVIGLDFCIFQQVCEFLTSCQKQRKPVVPISINLSRLHLHNGDTASHLHAIAQKHAVPSDLLEFELTESIFLNDFSATKKMIDELRSYGYRVSIDDFGSGYAGINIWQQLDFDIIKLDRVFLSDNVELSRRNSTIVPNLISISEQLNTPVLCEGVETAEQCIYLARLGCAQAQGFYFAKPMPPELFLQEYIAHDGAYPLPPELSKQAREGDNQPVFQKEKTKQLKSKNWSKKWTYLSLAVIAVLILSIFLILYFTWLDTNAQFENMVNDTLNAYTDNQKLKMLSHIENAQSALKAGAALIAEEPDQPSTESYMITLNKINPDVEYSYLSAAECEQYLNRTAEDDHADIERLRQGETVITDIRQSQRWQNRYCFAIGVPVMKNGRFLGAVRAVINAAALVSTDLYNKAQGEIVATVLTDDRGILLPTSAPPDDGVGQSLWRCLETQGMPKSLIISLKTIYNSSSENARSLVVGKLNDICYYLSVVDLGINGWHLVVCMKSMTMTVFVQNFIHNILFSIAALLTILGALFMIVLMFYRRLQKKILAEQQRYYLLESFSDTVLFELNCETDTLRFTPNASQLIYLTSYVQNNFLKTLNESSVYPGDFNNLKKLLKGSPGQNTGECRIRVMRPLPDQIEYFWCLIQCKYIYSNNKLTGVLGKITDIEKTVQNEIELRQKAETDSLTGLKNKQATEQQIKNRMRLDNSGMLIILDMDNFKQINDHHGHAAGDLILHQVGECIRQTFRNDDIMGRIGGDEMMVYMKNVKQPELAAAKADLLQRHMNLWGQENGISCSLSIGIAQFPKDASNYAQLYKRADHALYEAKGRGKKQYAFYNAPEA